MKRVKNLFNDDFSITFVTLFNLTNKVTVIKSYKRSCNIQNSKMTLATTNQAVMIL